MPAIEIEGTSSARYELRDGKIVRVEPNEDLRPQGPSFERSS